ncbi:radical SAM protein [Desulfonema ishimotonii]|uniref:Radical SAM protein n=1 Tax=Desulfonema ishimotonii TaxID=45657 RepID=A0A401G085_9BACT|nr:radical SAM protein [Desulfonema ishimotonii]GBC62593.1 radical SAM protein [Desulfonema ishimotonii]
MHYENPERMIRPPSEAHSILLQATVGCSHNKCTFCGAYKGLRFKIKPEETVMADIAWAAEHFRHVRRLFICDGDALIIPQKRLLKILTEIEKQLPWVTRVGVYANTKGIGLKSDAELRELRDHGLKIAYMGLESGDDVTLGAVRKGADAEKMIRMGRKIRAAGVRLSVTVLLGLAGKERSQIHAEETGRVLSAIDPEYVGALSLMLIPGTPMHDDCAAGKFELIDPDGMLMELRTMIAHTDMSQGLFHANHASNYLPIKARLPRDKAKTLDMIDQALAGKIRLKPEWMRAL